MVAEEFPGLGGPANGRLDLGNKSNNNNKKNKKKQNNSNGGSNNSGAANQQQPAEPASLSSIADFLGTVHVLCGSSED